MNWMWPSVWEDERGGWWRVPTTYVLFGGLFFILGSILMGELKDWGIQDAVKGRSQGIRVGVQLMLWMFPLCCSGLGCLLGIKFVHRKPVSCIFTDGRPFGFSLFLQSAIVGGVLWLVGVALFPGGLEDLNERFHEIRPASWPGVFVAAFSIIFFQAATEELLDRGYLQTRVAAWVKRPWLAVCISTTVFTLLHTGEISTPARVRLALIGATLGVGLIRANTVAPLIAWHVTSNALGVIWLPDLTNKNRNWLDVIFISIQLAIWLKWLFWATKTKDDQRRKVQIISLI